MAVHFQTSPNKVAFICFVNFVGLTVIPTSTSRTVASDIAAASATVTVLGAAPKNAPSTRARVKGLLAPRARANPATPRAKSLPGRRTSTWKSLASDIDIVDAAAMVLGNARSSTRKTHANLLLLLLQ